MIGQDTVTLAEGAAPAVLSAEANRFALGQEGPERQGFRKCPVDAIPLIDDFGTPAMAPLDFRVEGKAGRGGIECLGH